MAGSGSKCQHCGHGNETFKKCHLAIKKATEGANAMKNHAGVRKRFMTPEEDRYVSLVAEPNRNANPSQIAADIEILT